MRIGNRSAVKYARIFCIQQRRGLPLKVVFFLLIKSCVNVIIIQLFHRFFLNDYNMLGAVPWTGGMKIKETSLSSRSFL